VVKSYGKEEEFTAKLEKTSRDLRDAALKVAYSNSAIWPAIGVMGAIGVVLVAWVGGRMVIRDAISLGTLSAAILYLLRLQFPLIGLGWVASMIQRANVSIDRVAALRNAFVVDPAALPGGAEKALEDADGDRASEERPAGPPSLELRNLSFVYDSTPSASRAPANGKGPSLVGNGAATAPVPQGASASGAAPAPHPALRDISLRIPAGSSLGIVGPTGAGKTTLMHVLCGIYAPPEGALFLDGRPRESIPDAQWLRHFAYAPQDGFLFSTSIRNNIDMGRSARSVHTAEEAAEWSALSRDLAQFPLGYESMLGEKGINLSGGQRQRVGLARALLANSAVLGLDDTLSALDTETEALVLDQMRRHFAGRTVLIVSHRYSAVMGCDNIVFLSEGRILEQGTHAELLRKGGAYAAVWEKQKLTTALELD
jgi:ATP-binding cassette subfamily B protein